MCTVLQRCAEMQLPMHTCVMLDKHVTIFRQLLPLPVVCGWHQPTTSLALPSLKDICNPSPHNFTCLVPLFCMILPINTILKVYLMWLPCCFTVCTKIQHYRNWIVFRYTTAQLTTLKQWWQHVNELRYSDNVKNAENNTTTTAIYLYDLVFKHCKSFGCYATGSAI